MNALTCLRLQQTHLATKLGEGLRAVEMRWPHHAERSTLNPKPYKP